MPETGLRGYFNSHCRVEWKIFPRHGDIRAAPELMVKSNKW
jgi:hypothetical protein